MKILNRLFRLEEINGGERCPTYLYRWTLFQPRWPKAFWRGFGIYLHNFVGDDWSRDLHDHPKRFISIGLKGRYIEETPNKNKMEFLAARENEPAIYDCGCSKFKVDLGLCDLYSNHERTYEAPWIRSFPATHIHRLRLRDGETCWTLVVVLRHQREWGFWHLGKFYHWKEYVRGAASGIADKMRSCV